MFPGKSAALAVLIASAAIALGACRAPEKMANQPKYDPYEPSKLFADGMSARPLIEGTVARGWARTDTYLYTGKVGKQDGTYFPFPITQQVLERGRERFNIYCSECHDRLGTGNGMIVRRGFRQPPSYHIPRLRQAAIGHFFDVMTNGFGAMPPYNHLVTVEDRWAIAAYIRTLQLSQNSNASVVPADKMSELQQKGIAPEQNETKGAAQE